MIVVQKVYSMHYNSYNVTTSSLMKVMTVMTGLDIKYVHSLHSTLLYCWSEISSSLSFGELFLEELQVERAHEGLLLVVRCPTMPALHVLVVEHLGSNRVATAAAAA